MTVRPFEAVSLDELRRYDGEFTTIPVRIPLGISAFGVNAYAGSEAGARVIEEHDELGGGAGHHEELYVVVAGHASFTVDGEAVDAPAGTLVFVRDPAVKRTATAKAPETTVLVVGGVPGRAFEPSPWESWLEALPDYDSKDYARALETMRRALEKHPDNANVLYNLACCESLAGERESAVEHLTRAIALDGRAEEWARADTDFDPIRDDPAFPA